MKAVAEFVMRGRSQAVGLAVAAALIPVPLIQWMVAVIASLVVLRRGLGDGMFVLLWTIPAFVFAYLWTGSIAPPLVVAVVVAMAYVLRATSSWELALVTSVVAGVIGTWLFELVSTELLNEFVDWYRKFLLEMQSEAAAQNQSAEIFVPELEVLRAFALGAMATGIATVSVALLAMARWWQSLLYNPGGFQQEFHQIRLSPVVAGILVVLVLLSFSIEPLNRLVQVLTVPLLIAGIALMHWTVKVKGLTTGWLVALYLMALLLQLYPVLLFLAVLDSWFDLRKKIQVNEV